MYQIIVVSDSHGRRNVLDDLTIMYPNANFYLHAGDSLLTKSAIDPYLSVKGNCDFFIKNPFLLLEVGSVTIYMTHGHHSDLSNEGMINEARRNNADIIIHGHTHSRKNIFLDGVHILCPGSLANSRKGKESYAIITFSSKTDIKIEIIDL